MNQQEQLREFLTDLFRNAPETSGVYKMYNKENHLLYVGKAVNIRRRLKSYVQFFRLPPRLIRMLHQVDHVDYQVTANEVKALLLEAEIVHREQPRFNILLKDDKAFPSLFLSMDHEFPHIVKCRRERPQGKGFIFGPFVSGHSVNRLLDVIQKIFLLRTCSNYEFQNRKRPCLLYQIKRCSAPCCQKISHKDYQKQVLEAKKMLLGQVKPLLILLENELEKAVEILNFEKAALLRDKIYDIQKLCKYSSYSGSAYDGDYFCLIKKDDRVCVYVSFFRHGYHGGSHCIFFKKENIDVDDTETLSTFILYFYQQRSQDIPRCIFVNFFSKNHCLLEDALSDLAGGKKVRIRIPNKSSHTIAIMNDLQLEAEQRFLKNNEDYATLLEKLGTILNIPYPIKRIDVYDNSHHSGGDALGAVITLTDSGFHYKEYEIFHFENSSDDLQMMYHCVRKRLNSSFDLADVILVDGGALQIQAAQRACREEQKMCVVAGLLKNKKHNFETLLFDGKKIECPSDLFLFLSKISAEVHRFAIKKHRQKSTKRMEKSVLDTYSGIGSVRKKRLLSVFGSVENVADASIEDLVSHGKIPEKLARNLKEALGSKEKNL